MCARFDVTPRTLRHYEYVELLAPEREGRSRFYTARDIARMTLILRGRRFGFLLEEMRQWLEMRENQGTKTQIGVAIDATERQLEVLKDQRDELNTTIEDLEKLREEMREILKKS